MATRIQEAFEAVSRLTQDEQDRWADWLLEELASEQRWDELFANSQVVLERLAEEAEEDVRAGRVADLTEADFDL